MERKKIKRDEYKGNNRRKERRIPDQRSKRRETERNSTENYESQHTTLHLRSSFINLPPLAAIHKLLDK